MADRYVSHLGSNTSPYNSWATAATTLQAALTGEVAGDRIFVANTHTESAAAYTNAWDVAGTAASPCEIMCVDPANSPPTALSTGATFTTTSGGRIVFQYANYALVQGLTFVCSGDLATLGGMYYQARFKDCILRLTATSASLGLNNNTPGLTVFENFTIRFATGGYIDGRGGMIWQGGGLEAGTASPSSLFQNIATGAEFLLEGLDLSAGASSMHICNSGARYSKFVMRNCKLPSGWTGSLVQGTVGDGGRYEMWNCDSGDTNYRMQINTFSGTIRTETTVVREDGASDGTTPISWRFDSNSSASYLVAPLESPEIVRWNETVGTPITVSIETLVSTTALTDSDIWLDVQYLGTSGYPMSVKASDARVSSLTSAQTQDSSSSTWTTTGVTSPVKQTLSVTFTPQEKGMIIATVKVGKKSTTVYVCPKMIVS